MCVIQSVQEKKKKKEPKKAMKRGRRNKMSGTFFSQTHGLSENVSMCCV